jgi:hypothetical protein
MIASVGGAVRARWNVVRISRKNMHDPITRMFGSSAQPSEAIWWTVTCVVALAIFLVLGLGVMGSYGIAGYLLGGTFAALSIWILYPRSVRHRLATY